MWDMSYVNNLCKQCGFSEVKISSTFYPISPAYLVQRIHVRHECEPLSLYNTSMFKVYRQHFAGTRNVAVNDNGKIADIVDVAIKWE